MSGASARSRGAERRAEADRAGRSAPRRSGAPELLRYERGSSRSPRVFSPRDRAGDLSPRRASPRSKREEAPLAALSRRGAAARSSRRGPERGVAAGRASLRRAAPLRDDELFGPAVRESDDRGAPALRGALRAPGLTDFPPLVGRAPEPVNRGRGARRGGGFEVATCHSTRGVYSFSRGAVVHSRHERRP